MVNSYQNKMKEKIPIEITWMKNEDGILEPEIIMDAEDYVSFNTSIAEAIIKFKHDYLKLIEKTRSLKFGPKTRQMKKVWELGGKLANFNEKLSNNFIILNETEAFARDLGLSRSYIRFFMNFSKYFSKNEVQDYMSADHCRTFCDHAKNLKKLRLFKKEKQKLIQNIQNGTLTSYIKYREYLNEIANGESNHRVC